MASKQSQAVKDMYRAWTEEWRHPDPSAERPGESNDHWGDLTAEPRGVDYIEVDAGRVPGMWAVPKGCADDRAILCLHGGGFIGGSIYTHRKLFGHLAKAAGVRALLANYRLAPAHVFPTQIDDATTVFSWLLGQGFAPNRVALAGDSSGAGLCVAAVLRARERALPRPAALMLLSPWVDMEVSGASYESNRASETFFYAEVVRGLVAVYLGNGGNPKAPLANPLYADLGGLPPMYIQVGGDETLLDDSRRLAARARDAGVDVQLDVFPEQQHTFQMMAGRAPEADEAIRRFAAWLRPRLDLPGAL